MTKREQMLLAALIASICAMLFVASQPTRAANNFPLPLQRFQLLGAQITVTGVSENSSNSYNEHVLFKIDTLTGQTWRYTDKVDARGPKAKFLEGWKEIPDKVVNE